MAERTDPVVPDKHSRRLCSLPDFLFQAGDCPDSFLPASFYGGNSRMLYQPWERNGICYPQKRACLFLSPPSENILYLTPVFLAAALLLTLIPAGEKPVRWDTLRSIAAVLEEKTNALLVHTNYIFSGSRDTYGLSFTGYSGDGSVEGSLLPAPSSQLSVTGSRTKSPLYLTGTIHDFYNGHGWDKERSIKTIPERNICCNTSSWNPHYPKAASPRRNSPP